METLAFTIDLVLLGIFTVGLIMLSIHEASQERKIEEDLKRAA